VNLKLGNFIVLRPPFLLNRLTINVTRMNKQPDSEVGVKSDYRLPSDQALALWPPALPERRLLLPADIEGETHSRLAD